MRGFRGSRAAQQLQGGFNRGQHTGHNGWGNPNGGYSGSGQGGSTQAPVRLPDWLKTPETRQAEKLAQKQVERPALRMIVNNEKKTAAKSKPASVTAKKKTAASKAGGKSSANKKTVRRKAA